MIEPRDSFVAQNKETLKSLCDYCLEQLRKDVWGPVPNEEDIFFHYTESQLQENIKLFIRQYEIILPDLNFKKMEKEVKAVTDGFDVRVKIPFTRTKSITNDIFICDPLSKLRKIDYVNYDKEFNDDYTGTNAPKYIEVHLTIPDDNLDNFQQILDNRIYWVKEILNEGKQIIKEYNQKIEIVFMEAFEKRKSKILKGKNFVRKIKATEEEDYLKNHKPTTQIIKPIKKSNKGFLVFIISMIVVQTIVLLSILFQDKIF